MMARTTINSIKVKPRWRLVWDWVGDVFIASISRVFSSRIHHNLRMLRYRPSLASAFSVSSRAVLPAASLLVWGVVAFSAVSWGLRWSAADAAPRSTTTAAQALPEVDVSAAARTLGAAPLQTAVTPSPTQASRFQLLGVLAGGPHAGAALMSVDGQTAKPFRVGAVVADGWVLQSVEGRRVSLGATSDGPVTLALELPVKK
jgi:general secretion pathway protein C